jgi:hypothetical protein
LLVPITPFLLLLLEQGSLILFGRRRALGQTVALAALVGSYVTPPPVTAEVWSRGVANEWMYYSRERVEKLDRQAEILRLYFEGLPVRVASRRRGARRLQGLRPHRDREPHGSPTLVARRKAASAGASATRSLPHRTT